MKKRYIAIILTLIMVVSLVVALCGCKVQLSGDDAWSEFDKALAESNKYLEGKDYLIKYRYKEGETTITQKLNVSYTNSNMKDWKEFVIADRGVEKASKIKTDYSNTYFGYSLKSGVKAKKAKKEDYKLGYITGKTFLEGMDANQFFELKKDDIVNGKKLTADEEIYKYTLSYVLGTLDGINKDSAKIISAVKNGSVVTFKIVINDSAHHYGKYNKDSNCLIVQTTVGRVTKIYSANADGPVYYINYAGPKFTLPNYNGEGFSQVQM